MSFLLIPLVPLVLVVFYMFIFSYFHPAMGGKPKGDRLQKMKSSPNYANQIFQNNTPTSLKMPASSFVHIMWKW